MVAAHRLSAIRVRTTGRSRTHLQRESRGKSWTTARSCTATVKGRGYSGSAGKTPAVAGGVCAGVGGSGICVGPVDARGDTGAATRPSIGPWGHGDRDAHAGNSKAPNRITFASTMAFSRTATIALARLKVNARRLRGFGAQGVGKLRLRAIAPERRPRGADSSSPCPAGRTDRLAAGRVRRSVCRASPDVGQPRGRRVTSAQIGGSDRITPGFSWKRCCVPVLRGPWPFAALS